MINAVGGKRALKNDQLRQKLIDAMEQLMTQYGYDTINIRAICKVSGVSYGSFYNLFESKEKFLVYYLTNDFLRFQKEYYAKNHQFQSLDPLEKVIDIYACCGLYNDSKGYEFISGFYSSHNYGLYLPPGGRAEGAYAFTPLYEESITYLAQAKENKLIHQDLDLDVVARKLCFLFNGVTYNWCISQGQISIVNEIRELFDLYINSIKSETL